MTLKDLHIKNEALKILFNHIQNNFIVLNIDFYLHEGTIDSGDFILYNPNILYVAVRMYLGAPTDTNDQTALFLYDHTDTLKHTIINTWCYWNSVTNERHNLSDPFMMENLLFSRLFNHDYYFVNFFGYKITIA